MPWTALTLPHSPVFNITNPHEVLNGSKPVIQERGPLHVLYPSDKFDISWTDDRSVVEFHDWTRYVFADEETEQLMQQV